MKLEIAVIDYGMGNLRSVAKALELAGSRVLVTGEPSRIRQADAVVFPGVGSFGPAVAYLKRARLIDPLRAAIDRNKPFLGLCLGFQLLFDFSEEEGMFPGLGVIPGKVVRFNPLLMESPGSAGGGMINEVAGGRVIEGASGSRRRGATFAAKGLSRFRKLKIPHMGWNSLKINRQNGAAMFKGIAEGSYFYFVHSYYGLPGDDGVVAASTDYGTEFCSAVARDRVWACQFHPEKSGETGLKLLRNFVREAGK
jgi:glutamine amidotransferase